MHHFDARIWQEGFRAGETLFTQCPYAEGSWRAKNWYRGWTEGAAKALGHHYRAEPAGLPVQHSPTVTLKSRPSAETPLERARRYVAEAEMRVVRQTFIVSDMQNKGFDASQAQEVLNVFTNTLRLMHQELAYEKRRAGSRSKS